MLPVHKWPYAAHCQRDIGDPACHGTARVPDPGPAKTNRQQQGLWQLGAWLSSPGKAAHSQGDVVSHTASSSTGLSINTWAVTKRPLQETDEHWLLPGIPELTFCKPIPCTDSCWQSKASITHCTTRSHLNLQERQLNLQCVAHSIGLACCRWRSCSSRGGPCHMRSRGRPGFLPPSGWFPCSTPTPAPAPRGTGSPRTPTSGTRPGRAPASTITSRRSSRSTSTPPRTTRALQRTLFSGTESWTCA